VNYIASVGPPIPWEEDRIRAIMDTLKSADLTLGNLMIGGFALAAAPTEYRVTGVKSFIVSNDGVVYQKDLGPETLETFTKMELFNPDKTWDPVEDDNE
jgi:hypothetical protein